MQAIELDNPIPGRLNASYGKIITVESQALRMYYLKSDHSNAPDASCIICCLRLPLLLSVLFYHGYLSWPELPYQESKSF